jgi:hypothetical protein
LTWTATKAAIKAAVVSASGLHAQAVTWKRKPEAFAKGLVLLDVITAQQEVPDRTDLVYNAVDDAFDREASTVMLFTVSVRCESPVDDALELLEKVRSGLALPSVRETLSAAGVVVVNQPGPAVAVDNLVIDDRAASAYVQDVQFRAEFNRADPVQVTTIEHVENESEFEQIDGSLISDSETIDR